MAVIPSRFINATVAIGEIRTDGSEFWFGSGFLYGQLEILSEGEKRYKVFVVTNKHVLLEKEKVLIKFNPIGSPTHQDILVNLTDGSTHLLPHPDLDISAFELHINFSLYGITAEALYLSDTDIVTTAFCQESDIGEGNFCYLLGFPTSLIAGIPNAVIARHATIAQIRAFKEQHSKEIFIDTMNFPGNSGGPVVTKPDAIYVKNTRTDNKCMLLGIVHSYLPYTDVAVSRQTNRPRIVFEENSGLAVIAPAHFLKEWMDSLFPMADTQQGQTS